MLYADPGSGAMIWQLLLAFFFGVAFFFNRLRAWVGNRWAGRKNNEQLDSSAAGRLTRPLPAPTEGE